MSFSQRMDMRQGQSLVMTPQLQQAIKLLQLSNIELAEYIETELEKNPLLERGERDDGPDNEMAEASSRSDELKLDNGQEMGQAQDELDARHDDVYEADSPSESPGPDAGGPSQSTDWSQVSSGKGSGEGVDFEAILSDDVTLKEHLKDQLNMASLTPAERLIGARLIDEADDDGYMRGDLFQIAEDLSVPIAEVESILLVTQGFDPIGVMAPDLVTCLKLQLADQNRLDPAIEALLDNLHLVANHDIPGLMNVCGVDRADIQDMIGEIKALSPRPAAGFASERSITVVPDVFVRELPNGTFAVELNSDTLPRVLMNQTYYAEVASVAKRDSEKEFINECAANASWLIKSLDQRARTILKVAREIVRQQDAFFVHGISHLRPLNLKTVADAVEMHESTISRVTSNKYMATPRGLFELKYFFSAAIPSTSTGEAHSAEAVRHRIKTMIEAETLDTVLSDDQLVAELRSFGIDIARRTVAKYRESLKIPSSVQRRRLLRQTA